MFNHNMEVVHATNNESCVNICLGGFSSCVFTNLDFKSWVCDQHIVVYVGLQQTAMMCLTTINKLTKLWYIGAVGDRLCFAVKFRAGLKNSKLWPFFCNGIFSSIFFLEFDSTLTANNSL